MIQYNNNLFGLRPLFKLHGSAVSKALLPSITSTLITVIAIYIFDVDLEQNEPFIEHPYTIGCFMVAFTFLLTFRANFSYNRYWEACSAVHVIHSKWVDAAIVIAAFHYQSSTFDSIRPPSFGTHPQLDQGRRRHHEMMSAEELGNVLDALEQKIEGKEEELRSSVRNFRLKRMPSFRFKSHTNKNELSKTSIITTPEADAAAAASTKSTTSRIKPRPSKNPEHPSVFLQEAAHLLSLNSAVALSTLRNDMEGSESPLALFEANEPWPPVDPDTYSSQFEEAYWQKSRAKTTLSYICGYSRSQKMRTLYNAARPFRVIGGVSNAEVKSLQAARGPHAKIALCSMWLTEFVVREHMHGSTGGVSPPIISRVFQLISEGMSGYNQARKIAFIPFPFPHAQITSLFIVIIIFLIPCLLIDYVQNAPFAIILNFLTVLVFTGLHEVARELENPFQNAPNDIPLNNFQAQFNEAVITTFTGFHPDSWWEIPPSSQTLNENKSSLSYINTKHSSYLESCH